MFTSTSRAHTYFYMKLLYMHGAVICTIVAYYIGLHGKRLNPTLQHVHIFRRSSVGNAFGL